MSVYAITGELGTGKSLLCVSKIRDALLAGRRVATNLDLRLEHLVGPGRTRDVLRVPDFPSRADLDALGYGCDTYDEKNFGLLVIDEAATFLNSRDYRQEGRGDVIKWLLHSRKLRWDVFLIVQDLGMLDKQIRTAFVEHVVKCKRADRIGIPLLSAALSFLGFGRLTFPQIHFAIVRYGTSAHALVVDRWIYMGGPLYRAYDTSQKLIGKTVAVSQELDPKTKEPVEVVLEKSLHSVLCPARAAWLRKPRGLAFAWSQLFESFLERLPTRWRDILSAFRPGMTEHERTWREFALREAGVLDTPYNPPQLTYQEWLQGRAGHPGALGGPNGAGEAREPAQAPLQQAA